MKGISHAAIDPNDLKAECGKNDYDSEMLRNFLLILLVVLLPIRSWASESMGLQMAQSTHSVQTMTEGNASHCQMMQSSSESSNSQSGNHDKTMYQACSLCMAFGFTVPTLPTSVNFYFHQITVSEVLLIDSASLALPLKPPIS